MKRMPAALLASLAVSVAVLPARAETGEESQIIAESIVNTRPEVIARARELLGDMLK